MTQVEVLRPGELAGLKIQTASEAPVNFNVLVYGESGVGKTVLAGSACVVPDLNPVLFLDIEGGSLSLRKRYPEVAVIRIKTWGDIVRVFQELKKGKHDFRTVVVDSLTEAQKLGLATIMKRAVEKDEERDPDLPGIGEYGKSTNQMRSLVRSYRDLPLNVIFTCLSTRDQDKKGNWLTRPALTAKLSSEIAGFMDVVLYMYTKDGDDGEVLRLLTSAKRQGIIAKDRTDNLPDVIGDGYVPSVSHLHGYMFGELPMPTQPAPELAFPDETSNHDSDTGNDDDTDTNKENTE